MHTELIGLWTGLLFVSGGLYFTLWVAPGMPIPNRCRRFILIAPLHHNDPWGDKKREAEDKDDHVPWWFSVGGYVVILCCMAWPIMGFFVLAIVAMWMMWRFIQKITQSGPYAKQQQEGEQNEPVHNIPQPE